MLDIRWLREHHDEAKKDFKKRQQHELSKLLEEALSLDKKQRELMQESQELRASRNKLTDQVRELKKAGKEKEAHAVIKKAASVPEEIAKIETKIEKDASRIREILLGLPNLTDKSVPFGKDDTDNVEVRKWGKIQKFKFKPRDHVELLQTLDVADLERAANAAGARFYYLKNELVRLQHGLLDFALDVLADKRFTLLDTPYMLRKKMIEGATSLADFEDTIYKIENEDLYMIPTSEHPILALHNSELLDNEQLPLLYAGVSPCFRKEAGAHGKDQKGIFRVHQFHKVEQFVFCRPEDSAKWHELLIKNIEFIFQELELPYRIVNVCTGDLGIVAAKKYDLEAWMPVQNAYREMGSCSNCHSYQAVRSGIRFRTGRKNAKGEDEKEWVHTLNSTALATPRILAAILENFQQEDGSVEVPKVLRKYANGLESIEPKKRVK
ncbi:MAG TPA: serine--tRNA ligase [Candidatus Norongarragalinales archaeon]|jgi:seryl-tRNA synthetase|nr:serine--tRNA ligase [Candidatus Norongarragalinales archaeon]